MKRHLLSIIMMIGISSVTLTNHAISDTWNNDEIAAEVVWEVLHVFYDWPQTRKISKHPDIYHEAGPARFIIGEHPSEHGVDLFMGITAILHPWITDWLPNKAYIGNWKVNPRAMFQYTSIGVKGACVTINFKIGL